MKISFIFIIILLIALILSISYIIYDKFINEKKCPVCKECPECPECKLECPVCEECPECPKCVCPINTDELKRLKMIIYLLGGNLLPPVRNLYGDFKEQELDNNSINSIVNEYTKMYTGKSSTFIKNNINEIVNELEKDSKVYWQLAKGKVI